MFAEKYLIMSHSFKNVNSIPYNANFELDEENIKFLTLLDLNLTEFKHKIKPDIEFTFGFLHIDSIIGSDYFDRAFINLVNNLLIQVVKNRTEYEISGDLNLKLSDKLSYFSRDIEESENGDFNKLIQDLNNEILFYDNFKPLGIINKDINSFHSIINNYVKGLKDLMMTKTTN